MVASHFGHFQYFRGVSLLFVEVEPSSLQQFEHVTEGCMWIVSVSSYMVIYCRGLVRFANG